MITTQINIDFNIIFLNALEGAQSVSRSILSYFDHMYTKFNTLKLKEIWK